jgi:hypothetical protein
MISKKIITTDENIDVLFQEWVEEKDFDKQSPISHLFPIILKGFKQYLRYANIKSIKNKDEAFKLIQEFIHAAFSKSGLIE